MYINVSLKCVLEPWLRSRLHTFKFCLTHASSLHFFIHTSNPNRYDPQICGSKECPYVNLCLAQAAGFTDAQCNPPSPCTLDVKVCPTGQVYRRSPLLDCNFPPCPGQTCPLGELEGACISLDFLLYFSSMRLKNAVTDTCTSNYASNSHNRIVLMLIHCRHLQTFYGVQTESMSVAILKMDAGLIPAQRPALWILR